MLRLEFSEKFNINYVRATEPFALEELLALLTENDEPVQVNPGRATVLDLREVNLASMETPEIRRHIMKKSAVTTSDASIPCAYLVSGMAAFSAVRMALVYSELAGTTPEEMTFISEDLPSAGRWLANILSEDPSDIAAELGIITQPTKAGITRL